MGNQVGNFFIPSGETKDDQTEDKESERRQGHHPPKKAEEDEEEDEDEEDEEDLQDPDFDAMIEEGVKAGQLRVKVRINSSR